MSYVPRSQALIQIVTDVSTAGAFFSSPTGYVTLVKSLYVRNGAAATITFAVYLSPKVETGWSLLRTESVEPGKTLEWEPWFALNSEDAILLSITSGPAVAIVSGAVLAGPEQFPPGHALRLQDLPAQLEAKGLSPLPPSA